MSVVFIVIPHVLITVVPRDEVRKVWLSDDGFNIATTVTAHVISSHFFPSDKEAWMLMQDLTFNETDHDITWMHRGEDASDLSWVRRGEDANDLSWVRTLGRPTRTAEQIDGSR
jgi:hypothetical protein